jgi:biopolymer transport protein ExbD
MAAIGGEEGPITGINVTPLVDIILVVLIIFMATAPLIHNRAMKVDLPKAAREGGHRGPAGRLQRPARGLPFRQEADPG